MITTGSTRTCRNKLYSRIPETATKNEDKILAELIRLKVLLHCQACRSTSSPEIARRGSSSGETDQQARQCSRKKRQACSRVGSSSKLDNIRRD